MREVVEDEVTTEVDIEGTIDAFGVLAPEATLRFLVLDSGSGVGVLVGVSSNCTALRLDDGGFVGAVEWSVLLPLDARRAGADVEGEADPDPRCTSKSCIAMSASSPLPFFLPMPLRFLLFGAYWKITLLKSMNIFL